MNSTTSIQGALASQLGGRWAARPLNASGFCNTWRAEGPAGALFVKSAPVSAAAVLLAEADGLEALATTRTIRTPALAGCWIDAQQGAAVLALEWLGFKTPDAAFGARFGHALAALHRALPAEGDGRYGWRRDNMLGGTLQRNCWSEAGGLSGWLAFFGRDRLGAMRDRLAANSALPALIEAIDAVIEALPGFFGGDGYLPRASLIHGDLWSGNWGMLPDGAPVVYDPAVSCSDAEAELAMMELFGSPPAGFWPTYRESFGAAEGYERRRGLYQLYHLLNHALLFGGGYLRQSLSLAQSLL